MVLGEPDGRPSQLCPGGLLVATEQTDGACDLLGACRAGKDRETLLQLLDLLVRAGDVPVKHGDALLAAGDGCLRRGDEVRCGVGLFLETRQGGADRCEGT